MNNILYPPFDFTNLSLNKIKLLKGINKNKKNPINIKILGGYTFNNINDWLKIFTNLNDISIKIENSDWGSGFENSMIYLNKKKYHDAIIIFNSDIDLLLNDSINIDQNIIQNIVETYKLFFEKINKKKIFIIFNLFEYFQYNEIEKVDFKNQKLIEKLNSKLISLTKPYNNIIVFNPVFNFNLAKLTSYKDIRNFSFYGSIFDLEQSIMISFNYSIVLRSLYGFPKKVLVLDLDNTIWGGVIGDSKLKDIKIFSEDPEGRMYLKFQNYIKSLKKKGVLLAICSKNEEQVVKNEFYNFNMPLKLNDFISTKINWKSKYINIQEISKELNIVE